MSPEDLRTLADWKLKPLLLAVPGVADISVFGGEVRELQIRADPRLLAARQVSLAEVMTAAGNASALRGAGYIETQNQRLPLAANGQFSDPAVIGATVIRGAAADSIRIRDVATVGFGPAPKSGDALVMGKPGIVVALISQYGANTLEVTRAVEAALADFTPTLEKQGVTLYPGLHRPANFIEVALEHIRHSLFLGTLLVIAVLVFFLMEVRTALISFISIPLSLLTTVLVFRAFGVTLNTLTLGGFVVAIGVVVDDAIIDVENIVRRLRENVASPLPRPTSQVILEASLEVRGAIVYATLIVLAVFIPVFTMGGIQRSFFTPLGTAFVLATFASLLVAITVTPALCSLLLSRVGAHRDPIHLRAVKWAYAGMLQLLSRFPKLVMLAATATLAASLMLVPRLKTAFLPDFREGHFVIQLAAIPGTSLEEMDRMGKKISAELLQDPRIATVQMQIGRSERGVDTFGPERAEIHVELQHRADLDDTAVQESIRGVMDHYPGIQSEVLTFLGDRISETISGETASIVVSLFGEDLDALDAGAKKIGRVLSSIPGTADVVVQSAESVPALSIDLIPAALERFGLQPANVLDLIQTACQGTEVAQIYEGNQVISMTVKLGSGSSADPSALGAIPVVVPGGPVVMLRDLASIHLSEGRASINHDGYRRRQVITCNANGRAVSEVTAEARQKISSDAGLPAAMNFVITGTAEAEAQARRDLIISSAAAGAIVILLLWIVFRSSRHLTLVLANLPFSMIGGILAIYLARQPLSLGALVGFVTLFGISTRNAIMMMSHFEHLVLQEGVSWDRTTMLRGAGERLVPILMTALVTGLALLPLALHPEAAGQEIEGPMAMVILGGLVSSTALNLLVLPTLALRFSKFERKAGA